MDDDWHRAVVTGDIRRIRALLRRGAQIDSKDRHGQTALMLAARAGHLRMVEILVDRGADLDHTAKYGLSAVMLAVINRHPAIAEVLVRAGADLSRRGTGAPGFDGKAALQLAEEAGLTETARSMRAAIRQRGGGRDSG